MDFNAQRLAVLHNHVRETIRLAEDVHAGRAPQPQFVVWPEDASEIDPLLNADAAQQITAAVDAIGAPILVGTLTDVPGAAGAKPAARNTVIVWNPRTGPGERHDKQIVQPFGEYLPGGDSSAISPRWPTGRAILCPAKAPEWCTLLAFPSAWPPAGK